jgi:uncharacterized membrane protein
VGNGRAQRRAVEKGKAAVARQVQEQAPVPRPGPGQMRLEYEERVYSGPIPEASDLGQYEAVLPGLANRIVAMAEKQAKHRRRLETVDVLSEHVHVTIGQASALIVAIFFGWVAWDLGQNGQELLAAFLGAVDLTALVGLFIFGRRMDAEAASHGQS